jgi:hypothetical protein
VGNLLFINIVNPFQPRNKKKAGKCNKHGGHYVKSLSFNTGIPEDIFKTGFICKTIIFQTRFSPAEHVKVLRYRYIFVKLCENVIILLKNYRRRRRQISDIIIIFKPLKNQYRYRYLNPVLRIQIILMRIRIRPLKKPDADPDLRSGSKIRIRSCSI